MNTCSVILLYVWDNDDSFFTLVWTNTQQMTYWWVDAAQTLSVAVIVTGSRNQITAHKSHQTFSLFIHSFAVMLQCWRSGWAYTTLGEVKKKVVFLSNMAARCPARRLNNPGLASWSHLSTCLSFTPKLLFWLQTSRIPPEFWNSGWLIILGFFIGLLVV